MMEHKPKRRYLTDHGMELLDTFIYNKSGGGYDVRIEILDHYVIEIEQLLNENPKMTFIIARNEVHKKLGETRALKKIVKAKQKQIRKYWNKKVNHFLIGYLKWPKMVMTLLLFFFFFSIISVIPSQRHTMLVMLSLQSLVASASYLVQYRSIKASSFKIADPKSTLYSFECFMESAGTLFVMALAPMHIQYLLAEYFEGRAWLFPIIISIGVLSCTYLSLKAHAFHTEFRYWIKDELEAKYPDYLKLVRF